jgi:hypothetical protein
MGSGCSGTNDADFLCILRMSDYQQSPNTKLADSNQAWLTNGMVFIGKGSRQRITEHGSCFIKVYAMLFWRLVTALTASQVNFMVFLEVRLQSLITRRVHEISPSTLSQ